MRTSRRKALPADRELAGEELGRPPVRSLAGPSSLQHRERALPLHPAAHVNSVRTRSSIALMMSAIRSVEGGDCTAATQGATPAPSSGERKMRVSAVVGPDGPAVIIRDRVTLGTGRLGRIGRSCPWIEKCQLLPSVTRTGGGRRDNRGGKNAPSAHFRTLGLIRLSHRTSSDDDDGSRMTCLDRRSDAPAPHTGSARRRHVHVLCSIMSAVEMACSHGAAWSCYGARHLANSLQRYPQRNKTSY